MSHKINVIVHDLYAEIGHCRAMLEILRCYKKEQVSHINFICFTHDQKEKILPTYDGIVTFKKIPFPNLKPFMIKSLFFQIYTYLFQKKLILENSKTITIGVCSLIGDIVNVQFVHHLWTKLYFTMNRPSLFKKIYKKILLNYLEYCEKLYYKKKRPKLVCLSRFIEKELQEKYQYTADKITTAYSSASSKDFFFLDKSRDELLSALSNRYDVLKKIDLNKPILLFVGAFERKGLSLILDNIDNDQQLIVIGKPEVGSHIDLRKYKNIFHINFTKEINHFFNLCDCFIFPTSYEPFGLVVIEAAATGMNIIVTKKNVGASELLEEKNGVFFSTKKSIKELIKKQVILSGEQRAHNISQRKVIFERNSWEKSAIIWLKAITT